MEETLEALHDLVKAGKVRYLGASSMRGWEFAKALHLQRRTAGRGSSSMQDHYNLLAREEEREMLPLCADEGVGTIVWSPLARGRLARAVEQATAAARSTDGGFADMLYAATEDSDRAIIDAVGAVADARGVTPRADRPRLAAQQPRRGGTPRRREHDRSRSTTRSPPSTSTSPTTRSARLEQPYTPRYDFQGISSDAEMQQIMARIPQFTTASQRLRAVRVGGERQRLLIQRIELAVGHHGAHGVVALLATCGATQRIPVQRHLGHHLMVVSVDGVARRGQVGGRRRRGGGVEFPLAEPGVLDALRGVHLVGEDGLHGLRVHPLALRVGADRVHDLLGTGRIFDRAALHPFVRGDGVRGLQSQGGGVDQAVQRAWVIRVGGGDHAEERGQDYPDGE